MRALEACVSTREIPVAAQVQIRDLLSPALEVARLRRVHLALQRRVLHRWLTGLGIPDIGFREVEAVRALIQSDAMGAKVNLPRGHHARRKAGRLFILAPPDDE